MFGILRQLSATSISACILRCMFHYATFLGIIWFGIRGNRIDGCLVAKNRYWYKWFCLISRILICGIYIYVGIDYIITLDNVHMIVLSWIRLFSCVTCAIVILIMQFWYGQQMLRVVNCYLRLFRRVKALPGCHNMQFGGKRELSLLFFEVLSLLYGISCELPELLSSPDVLYAISVISEMYCSINAAMICNICFVAYLSVGALFDQFNSYVRHELRRQLRGLEQSNGCQPSRRQLKAAGCRLDECLAIYDEIQRVASIFQRLFDLPLCLILICGFLSIMVVSYCVMLNQFRGIGMWLLLIKMFMDVVLLTLAIHGAGSSSRVVRRLSLENCYVSERNEWHMKVLIRDYYYKAVLVGLSYAEQQEIHFPDFQITKLCQNDIQFGFKASLLSKSGK